MNLRRMIKSTWAMGLLLFSFLACTSNNTQTTDTTETQIEEETTEGERRAKELERLARTTMQKDATKVDADYYVIRYVTVAEPTAVVRGNEIDVTYVAEDVPKAVVTADEPKETAAAEPKFTKNRVAVPEPIEGIDAKIDKEAIGDLSKKMTIRYLNFGGDVDQDRPPIFDKDCLGSANLSECTENSIHAFIEENIDYPQTAIDRGHDGYERVIFVVGKDGKVLPNIKVASKDKPCAGCAKAAVEVISQMPDWVPAIENGRPISTEVSVPIRFKYVGS